MDLLSHFMAIAGKLRKVFRQQRTTRRAVSLLTAGLLCLGRHWISRWRWLRGGEARRWSADYKRFSRARWDADRLFEPAIRHGLPFAGSGPIVLAGDEKQQIGIADPQVWNDLSVDRQPAFLVAGYSFLLLAALEAYGPARTEQYLKPPPWQRSRRSRPSCEDLLAMLRTQAAERDGPEPHGLPFRYDPKVAVARSAA